MTLSLEYGTNSGEMEESVKEETENFSGVLSSVLGSTNISTFY